MDIRDRPWRHPTLGLASEKIPAHFSSGVNDWYRIQSADSPPSKQIPDWIIIRRSVVYQSNQLDSHLKRNVHFSSSTAVRLTAYFSFDSLLFIPYENSPMAKCLGHTKRRDESINVFFFCCFSLVVQVKRTIFLLGEREFILRR